VTGVGGVGLGVSGLSVVFFILSSSSQAILAKAASSICGGICLSNSCRVSFDFNVFYSSC